MAKTLQEKDHTRFGKQYAWKKNRAFPCVNSEFENNVASKMKKKNFTREVGFHLSLKLKKICIVGKKSATEVS